MARIPSRSVFPLSGRSDASSAVVDTGSHPWDLAIAGQVFTLAASEDTPLIRQSAPIRKEQQDTESEPGEQSLEGWWLRSQESFHKGAGVLYQESRVEQEASERFQTSMGVDVWTPGEIRLLKSTTALQAGSGTSLLATAVDGTTPVVYQATGTTLYRITASGSATVTWGGAGTIIDLEVWDGYYYVTDSTGVWRGTIAGGAGAKLWTLAGPGTVRYRREGGFALLLVDNNAYDVTVEAGSPVLPAPFLTLKEAGWKWTAITRARGTLRAAGHSSGSTAIWRFTPTISSSGWTFEQATGLPRGEIVYSLDTYYGNYLVLGTSLGVRFAVFDDASQYTFGPLTWEVPTNGGPVRGVRTIGRYVYATAENGLADGSSGLIRIDPEMEISDGRFAWANDLGSNTTGTMGDVADLNGRPVFCLSANGSYVEHLTNLVTTGYLTTGRIRFRTLEPKLFKLLRVRADPLVGTISASATGDAGSSTPVASWTEQGSSDLEEANLPQIIGSQEAMAVTFTLARSSATTGPVMRSYQLKALPAPKRQRIYKLPLSCFDTERLANGQSVGYKGYAIDRLNMLEAAEERGDLVIYQDLKSGVARSVVIEDITFRQTSPPARSVWGGYIYLTVRTAD